MSRNDKRRHRDRKARRRARKAEEEECRARGVLPPWLRGAESSETARRDGSRWASLRARGGLQFGFKPTGVRVPVDLDAPDAEHALAIALADRFHRETGES
jgi:hypothetical protein